MQFSEDERLVACKELDHSNQLVDEFRDAFRDRYGAFPSISAPQRTALKDLGREIGFVEAKKYIRTFLKMDRQWFVDRAHDPLVLKKDINAVIAEHSRLNPKEKPVCSGPRFSTELSCDSCFQYFTWTGYAEQLDDKRLCPKCKPGGMQ